MHSRRAFPASRDRLDLYREIDHADYDVQTQTRRVYRNFARGAAEAKAGPYSVPSGISPHVRDTNQEGQSTKGSRAPVSYMTLKSSPRPETLDDPASSIWIKARRGTPRNPSGHDPHEDLWARAMRGSSSDARPRRSFQASGMQSGAYSQARLGAKDGASDLDYVQAQVVARSNHSRFRTDG
jgi:hypothetical protein